MKKFFKSINSSILFAFLSLLIPIILIFLWTSVNYTEKSIIENSKGYTLQLIDQVNSTVDSYIDFMENISKITLYSGTHSNYLMLEDLNSEEANILKKEILNQFSTVIDTREDIYSIGIYGENGRLLVNDGTQAINKNVNIKEKIWYNRAIQAKGEIALTAANVQNIFDDSYRWVVNLSRAVVNKNGDVVGVFWVDLNFNTISNFCEGIDLGKRGYVFVLDEHGNIVYHPKQQLIYSGLKLEKIAEVMKSNENAFILEDEVEDDSRLYTVSTSEKTGWKVVGVSYISELLKEQNKLRRIYIYLGILMIPIAMIISYIVSKKITKPIKLLKNSMKEVEIGNFKPTNTILIDDSEIGKLGKAFSIMTERIGGLMEEKIKDEKFKRDAEMKALQSQINPHFLYNTLDSIVWMAESENNREVILMTVALARLLRQSISTESAIVKISDEIKYCESYLTIQKQRYLDQLNFKIDIPENILQGPIIKLTLQPIVENAIYHGIKYGSIIGEIIISGYEEEGNIVIIVQDNGLGMSKEELEEILKKKNTKGKSNGLGVYNVDQRIKLYFGQEYGLDYQSELGKGTKVVIKLPKEFTEID